MKFVNGNQARRRSASWSCMALLAVACLSSGCGRSNKDYIPAASDARIALDAALKAWETGAKSGEAVPVSAKPGMLVELFDSDFAGGRKLTQWQVEGGGTNTDGPRQFTVQVTIEGSPPNQTVTYYVTGVGGRFSIFRDRDYEQRASQM